MKLQKKTQQQASIEQQRSGFSLVELLVVIAIIGILMALLLPAVQSARESGRKTACMSNAYQLGMAVNRFDQDKGKVPGWRQALSGRNVSWPIICLPYLERNDLFNEWNGGAANPSGGTLGVFICPSAPANPTNGSPLVYVGNCGVQGNGLSANSLKKYCGVMVDGTTDSYSLEDVADGDGTATTLLFAEKAMGDNFDFQKIWGRSNEGSFLNANNCRLDPNAGLFPNILDGYPAFGLAANMANTSDVVCVQPRSAHPGGGVVAFCDGHTYFLGNDVNTTVYTQLVTSNGSRLPNAGDYSQYKVTTLNEGAY